MNRDSGLGSFLAGVVIGGLIGAAIGLLLMFPFDRLFVGFEAAVVAHRAPSTRAKRGSRQRERAGAGHPHSLAPRAHRRRGRSGTPTGGALRGPSTAAAVPIC